MLDKEKKIEVKSCKQCNSNFIITDKDVEFYDKISPKFNDEKYYIPVSNFCPECRQQSRLLWRNERNLYKNKCSLTGKEVISLFSPDKKYKIFNSDDWWSDKWNPLDYGRDFDFSKTFSEQYNELLKDTPHSNLFVQNNENGNYVNYSANTKNSYLIFASSQNEDSCYSRWVMNCKKIFDSNNCSNCEVCYECIDCVNLFNSSYCIGSIDSNNCFASYDLIGCNNCISCYGLRNKSYCIENIEYSKEEFNQKKENIKINQALLKNTLKKGIHKSKYILNSENCSGDYIINSKNIINGFDIEKAEDCKNISNILDMDNSQDIDFQAFDTHLCYNNLGIEYSSNILFSFGSIESKNILYSFFTVSSSNLFGCVNLKNKQYCILNKQYTKEEYNILVPKIIEHMIKTLEWGEFFKPSISPFGYNETLAQEYFPFSKANALYSEFNWSDYESPFPKVEKIIKASKLPNNIKDIPDDILNWAIECEVTKKPYRIIKQELEFYRKNNISIPKKHPDLRHIDRLKMRNERKIYDRKCHKCGTLIKTSYSPDREEIVYCEECYNKYIY